MNCDKSSYNRRFLLAWMEQLKRDAEVALTALKDAGITQSTKAEKCDGLELARAGWLSALLAVSHLLTCDLLQGWALSVEGAGMTRIG